MRHRRGRRCEFGLAYVQSVGEAEAKSVVAQQPYGDLGDLARRASVKQDALEALVAAGRLRRVGAAARAALAARCHPARRDGRRRQPPARAAARADRGDPGAAGADAVGADARRLQAHVALGRRPSACSCCARTCRPESRRAPTWPRRRTGRGSRWPAWRSPASGRRPRTASSSCCSRTSTARRT